MTIYVDADACPVKAEAERTATRHRHRLVIVSNGGIRPSANPLVETVIVPEGPDEADKWIAARAGPGDIVITGDIPLAARCIEGGAQVGHQVARGRSVPAGAGAGLRQGRPLALPRGAGPRPAPGREGLNRGEGRPEAGQ